MNPLVFALPGNEDAALSLSTMLGGELGELTTSVFPDLESYLRVDSDPRSRNVVVVATLRDPNPQALPLLFLADTLRDLGAARVGLVAPYLAYMRQDARFKPGEAVTSRSFAALVSRTFDWLVTVDPHLHRVATLGDLYTIPATAVRLAPTVGRWIAAHVDAPLIIGPDAESRQWVDGIAATAGAPSTVLTKTRRGDRDVVESIPDLREHLSRTPVLVDDIISTGQTMVAALRHLREQGARPAFCIGVHGVFAPGAYEALIDGGAARIVTSNTIPHRSSDIDALPAIADALQSPL